MAPAGPAASNFLDPNILAAGNFAARGLMFQDPFHLADRRRIQPPAFSPPTSSPPATSFLAHKKTPTLLGPP